MRWVGRKNIHLLIFWIDANVPWCFTWISTQAFYCEVKFKFPLHDRLRNFSHCLDRDDIYPRKHQYEELKKFEMASRVILRVLIDAKGTVKRRDQHLRVISKLGMAKRKMGGRWRYRLGSPVFSAAALGNVTEGATQFTSRLTPPALIFYPPMSPW